MLIKARPAKSQIERIVGFQFWWETWADFEYFGVIRGQQLHILIDFHLYLYSVGGSEKTHFLPLGGRFEAETQFRSPQGLEQEKWREDVEFWFSRGF